MPPPEEREHDRKRLDAIRPWHRLGWILLGTLVVIAFCMKLKQMGGW